MRTSERRHTCRHHMYQDTSTVTINKEEQVKNLKEELQEIEEERRRIEKKLQDLSEEKQ